LPLSGSPRLAVVGSRVQLGANQADVIAIEPSGRLVLFEVKLARNAEARRAVVAQILSYAAFLAGLDYQTVEREILSAHLERRAYDSLAAAAAEVDEEASSDVDGFYGGLSESLSTGAFRLVLILDEAPEELVRLVGYLESVGDKLVIDLITVASYEVAGSQLIVPQRIDPVRRSAEQTPATPRRQTSGETTEGADEFVASIAAARLEDRPALDRLATWALDLERAGLAKLKTYVGKGRTLLLVWVKGDNAGLVTIWNEKGAAISLYRSVFERRAPSSLARVEAAIAPSTLGQGNAVREVSDELLDALSDAYREAAPTTRGSFDWSRARRAVEAIPPGHWTSYGDIAEFAGTAAQPVGLWATSKSAPNQAYLILSSTGRVSEGFRWNDPSDTRDVHQLLRERGIRFDESGAADQTQRLRPADLARLVDEPPVSS
jgi:alkylated DNA nucleotide flippase Atl1